MQIISGPAGIKQIPSAAERKINLRSDELVAYRALGTLPHVEARCQTRKENPVKAPQSPHARCLEKELDAEFKLQFNIDRLFKRFFQMKAMKQIAGMARRSR